LEERFAKYPDPTKIPDTWMGEPGRPSYEAKLGVTKRKAVDFNSYVPTIVFSHPEALGYQNLGNRKGASPIRAIELPYWGTAQKVMEDYYL
jgi:hypothetical protein